MPKKILLAAKARAQLIKGIDILANTVKVTLGPRGRNVGIETLNNPKITKDGVTVARAIELKDPYQKMGAQLIRAAAAKTADTVGDGTTTATVLTQAIVKEGNKAVTAGFNPMDLKRGIDMAVEKVVEYIKTISKPVNNTSDIAQVGTISANGEREIGEKIALAVEKVGKEGTVTVEEGKKFGIEVEVIEGMKIDSGYISPHFVTNPEKMNAEFTSPYILVCDQKISTLLPLHPILEEIIKSGAPLIIIAEDIEADALGGLLTNRIHGSLKVVGIKAPSYADNKKNILHDIAILTGATLISTETGKTQSMSTLFTLGRADKVTVNKNSTIIVGGKGDTKEIENRCAHIRKEIQDMAPSFSSFDKDNLKERLAKLTDGIAVIRVGGATDVEVREKKDRIDDALHATRAAVEEGIVPGGGTTLFSAITLLEDLKGNNEDQQAGINIVKKALEAPVRQIAENAGVDGAIVVGKLNEQNTLKKDNNIGFDAQTLTYVDMFKAGIIDPAKIVRSALQDAASIATLVITTEAIVVEEEHKPEVVLPARSY